MIPCLTKQSLKLLAGTADERYHFSPEYFRKTHYPQVLHRYHNKQSFHEVTQAELLEELLDEESFGNRITLILGSTGSGKSELLCWLRDEWQVQSVPRPVIRISRTELNPQILIAKCYQELGIEMPCGVDVNKWEMLLQKPITLVNQMIWTTLTGLFDSDEQIVPFALLLRPIVEKNILLFAEQVVKRKINTPLQLITDSQFKEIIESTTLSLHVDLPYLRHLLSQQLDQFLFQGMHFGHLFTHLTDEVNSRGIRPLLLIDDLVQSVNLYAAELLDSLITLEEGNWDVVVGLTPGSLQDTEKGADLVHRMMNLDTIDDRVKKLWLSDESGHSFFSLSRDEVVPYMKQYLTELKRANGFPCSLACLHADACSHLLMGESAELELLPFNASLVKRLYDGIPSGKGKLRYMILHTKEVMRFFMGGKTAGLKKVLPLVNRSYYVEHPDMLVKTLGEWYVEEGADEVSLPSGLLTPFKVANDDDVAEITVSARKVTTLFPVLPSEQQQGSRLRETETDVAYSQIRDWIEGENVNEELLDPVRAGVATLVQDLTKATFISRPFTSRTSSMIQRKEVEKGVRYPITLPSSSASGKHPAILVSRSIHALDVAGFQQLKPREKGRAFAQLASYLQTAEWVYEADSFRDIWRKEMEEQLGMSLPVFAAQLREWALIWKHVASFEWLEGVGMPFSNRVMNDIEGLFLDWYGLRDNMVDAWMIDEGEQLVGDFTEWLLGMETKEFITRYQMADWAFGEFVAAVQQGFGRFRDGVVARVRENVGQFEKMVAVGKLPWERADKILSLAHALEKNPSMLLCVAEEVSELDRVCRENGLYESLEQSVTLQEQQEKERELLQRVVPVLVKDRGYPSQCHSLEEVLEMVRRDHTLRPRVRQSVIALLEAQSSVLPPVQWKGIVEDLQKQFPSFYGMLRLQITFDDK